MALPHEHFGSYLDNSGNTIDADLEREKFQKAGEILCDIWNDISIDNHTVKCSYRNPTDEPKEIDPTDHEWVEKHCSISNIVCKFLNVMMFLAVENPGQILEQS